MSDEKVYVITHGCYSDYGIVTVFKNKENAEKFIEEFKDCEIEEYEFSDEDFKKIPLDKKVFVVRMDRDGSVDLLMEEEKNYFIILKAIEKEDRLVDDGRGGKFMLEYVIADDEKHAVKIVNEKRTRLIAENKWPEKK